MTEKEQWERLALQLSGQNITITRLKIALEQQKAESAEQIKSIQALMSRLDAAETEIAGLKAEQRWSEIAVLKESLIGINDKIDVLASGYNKAIAVIKDIDSRLKIIENE